MEEVTDFSFHRFRNNKQITEKMLELKIRVLYCRLEYSLTKSRTPQTLE